MQAAGTYSGVSEVGDTAGGGSLPGAGHAGAAVGVLIARTPFPHTGMDYTPETLEKITSQPLFKRKHFVFAVVAQFLYVGAQVGAWSWQIPYVQGYTGLGSGMRVIG